MLASEVHNPVVFSCLPFDFPLTVPEWLFPLSLHHILYLALAS
jgi:hypothetical protein